MIIDVEKYTILKNEVLTNVKKQQYFTYLLTYLLTYSVTLPILSVKRYICDFMKAYLTRAFCCEWDMPFVF